ncbi:MAG: hypothetical protein M5T61_17105 [Acidimicrobiia bacterium]|nr:hypothetical protein [Acidimicrobiia bacterium]
MREHEMAQFVKEREDPALIQSPWFTKITGGPPFAAGSDGP